MLKPAVEACTNADGFSKSPHIAFGQEIGLGLAYCLFYYFKVVLDDLSLINSMHFWIS
jgi:hypothetical protein